MKSIFFQAVGCPVKSVISSIIRDIVCFVPLVITLPIIFENAQAGNGINGILWAAPAADFISMIVATVLTILYFKKLDQSEKVEVKDGV